MHLTVIRRGVQTPLMKWWTQFLGHRTAVSQEYMRYADTQAPRTYPARTAPPSQNEKLHGVAYIYRDERRMVQPPTVVFTAATGASSDERVAAPTPGFGTKWSLNEMDPVIRSNSDFGLVEGRDYVNGYDEKYFYKNQQ